MLRSVRYGLYGLIVAALVAGVVAWTHIDKTVQLVVDGHARTVHTTASSVGQVVEEAGYRIGKHDLLAPSADAAVHEGTRIVYKRGRLLHLSVDGQPKDVWTTAPTVAVALQQLGYPSSAFVSVSRSRRLPLHATDITVRTPKTVSVVHDGKTDRVSTTVPTVAALLRELGIRLDGNDRISLPTDAAVSPGGEVVIQRVEHTRTTATRALPFSTRTEHDSDLLVGKTKIAESGHRGLKKITYSVVTVDGKVVKKTRVKAVVVRKPQARVKVIGTKPKPVPPPEPTTSSGSGSGGSGSSGSSGGSGSSGSGSSGGSSSGSGSIATPSEAKAIARDKLAARGWSDQWGCLDSLWSRESGWRVTAANPSGAYGIPQALPGSKMGPGWQSSATVQISWGLSYIADRYGTPCGAWSYWQSHNYY